MLVKQFGWGGLALGLALGLVVLFAFGGRAVADQPYVGDAVCAGCHVDDPALADTAQQHGINYDNYIKHGHKWQLVHTAGTGTGAFPPTTPPQIHDPTRGPDGPVNGDLVPLQYPASPDFPAGVPLPNPTAVGVADWSQVEYVLGAFHGPAKGSTVGHGYIVTSDGKVHTSATSSMGYSCGKCHTTNYKPYDATTNPHRQPNHLGVEMAGAAGTWDFENIQCEVCHGPGGTMYVPLVEDRKCQQCHTSDQAAPLTGLMKFNPYAPDPADPTGNTLSPHGYLTGSHSQGDEFDHSPAGASANDLPGHRAAGCVACHDPHRSVWHDLGGVVYSEEAGTGNMCKHCHQDVYVRGAMGTFLDCTNCHMPEASMSGSGASHLFQITTDATDALHNTSYTQPNQRVAGTNGPSDPGTYVLTNSKLPDTATNRTYFWNVDAATGNSYLTLDLACANTCHADDFLNADKTLNMLQLSRAAKGIHREPKVVDVTVNGSDGPLTFTQGTKVSVDFSVQVDAQDGVTAGGAAKWYVVGITPNGMKSWNAKKSFVKANGKPYQTTGLVDILSQNVLTSNKLSPGYYTYWVEIDMADGSAQYYDSVSFNVVKPPKAPKVAKK